MWLSPLAISLPTSGSQLTAALPYLAAIIGPALGYFAARFSATARLEKTLLDASRSWVEQSQVRHAQDGVLISTRDAIILEREAEIIRQRGEINQHLQREVSLENFIERSGLKIPGKS